ncbi:hypothetical protein HMPREF0083_03834 [Aneurinibacillus aneurinilyticus ATCC 12856]|uniref:Uncharacterized protein n=1 Tax=Aneurinibacillus aneurinilyticus ATCC 12856 TaxID=649747 RepID=U1WZG7_ANEAE|nr:hypothetical protein HMPREF0083_03834 [Aneurinibacillus aneurinilyticus ATCC 12856]
MDAFRDPTEERPACLFYYTKNIGFDIDRKKGQNAPFLSV